ncbi:hypothetical protein ADIS_4102 [Lunatimonas lonarensis]|uniref:Uncharacterized protein n=1 Tax=Lunatimonas lonarensis TaxID=1232681 RepID=R7ZMT5_9BACT|nr:hypothetical protein [Lunatimonas lonarensis]EON75398.1 hypothetical protein ADIS_4102 [Lunatimonas lonarensis]
MNRHQFLKHTLGLGAGMLISPLFGYSLDGIWSIRSRDVPFWDAMVAANDRHVAALMAEGDRANRHGGRSYGYNFAIVAASFACPDSQFFRDGRLLPLFEHSVAQLKRNQRPDGTINAGNLESPPDTAFIMEPLCAGIYILMGLADGRLAAILAEAKPFVLKAGDAMLTGGVHTPNHRWVVCHALARINQLYPDPAYVRRIDEWLAEGIFLDEDGHYPERSMNYSDVENNAFITLGRLLERPSLFAAPRKSLEMTYYYMEPNGDLVTFDSRRQDQYGSRSVVVQYLHYRFLAVVGGDGKFAAIARQIEGFQGFDRIILGEALFYFMENPQLRKPLPPDEPVSTDFERIFASSSLVRIRRGDTTVTLFGGVDWPLIIASGRSVSPNFFSYRKGKAILRYMRLSPAFFSMGYFRSEGLWVEGNTYVLYQKLEAPYYQPLPDSLKNTAGDYELTPSVDGRFWSKMAFPARPVSNVKTLETTISLREDQGEVRLEFEVSGLEGVAVTIEMNFDERGTITGLEPADREGENYFLAEGEAVYELGGDRITFGPGLKEHERIRSLDGEQYSVHFGSLRTEGTHVYITGVCPFHHVLMFS